MRDGLQVAFRLERWGDFEKLAGETYESHVRVLGAADPGTLKCLRILVQGYEIKGDDERAEHWQTKLSSAKD